MDFIPKLSPSPKWLTCLIVFCVLIRTSAVEIRCGKPGKAPLSRYTPEVDSYGLGSVVKYSCEPPQLISKPDQRICQEGGTWSEIIPICYDRASVQEFLHSSVLRDLTAAKAVDGNPTTCFSTAWERDGRWTAILPTPSTVTAVKIDFPSNFKELSNVVVIVKAENSAEGACILQNNYSGMQTSQMFYCPAVTNGKYVDVRYRSSSEIYFQICEVVIFIRPKETCFKPDIPYNGFGNMLITASERKYHYFCIEGYQLVGGQMSSCRSSGPWTPRTPVCHRIQCFTPVGPINGKVRIDDVGGFVPFNGRAVYSCNSGFFLQGNMTRTCVGWGKWSGDEPLCIAQRCGPVTAKVANGELFVNSTSIDSTAFLVCNDGYQALSDDRIRCLPSGLWSHASLICAPIRCDPNPTIPHGSFRLLANSTFYGSRLQVICDRGYVIRKNGLRMCERDGQWEELSDVCAEIACDAVPQEVAERGSWHLLNDSIHSFERPIRVLKCHSGFHIVGEPPIVRCLENGSWSLTTATCMKTPEAVMSTGEWAPNLMLFAAAAIGAGTVVCILCMCASFFGIRKRRQMRTNTTVFHVGNSLKFVNTQKAIPGSAEEHYYTSAMYEELPENAGYEMPKTPNSGAGYQMTTPRKSNPGCVMPKPRKPSAGLPLLPLDTDPVYAQPFETGSSASVAENKLRKGPGNREDPYSGHIYAEPIDSRRPPSGSSTVSGCIAETWFRGGTTVKMTRKMSLPNCQQMPKTGSSSSFQKTKGATRTSSTTSLSLKETEKWLSQDFSGELSGQISKSVSDGSFGLFADLQDNSIYLRTDDQGLQLRPITSGYDMTHNDIYLDKYFSQA